MHLRALMRYGESEGFRGDPAAIRFVYDYNICTATHAGLVRIDEQNQYRPFSLESYVWVDDKTLELKVAKGLKNSYGRPITSHDLYHSLKRIIVKQDNSHGNLNLYLCDKRLSGAGDTCAGLELDEPKDLVRLHLREAKYRPHLIPQLTSIDYAIVPYDAIDWSRPDLPIIDPLNTAGVYFVESLGRPGEGPARLKLNRSHPIATGANAATVEVVRFDYNNDQNNPSKFQDIDFVDFALMLSGDLENVLVGETYKFEEFATLPIALHTLHWTLYGIENTRVEERRYIGRLYRQIYRETQRHRGFQDWDQYFPATSEGSLNPKDNEELLRVRELDVKRPSRPINFFARPSFPEYKDIFEHPETQHLMVPRAPSVNHFVTLESHELKIDLYRSLIDSQFSVLLSQFAYLIRYRLAGFTEESGHQFLKEFLSLEDRKERLDFVRSWHKHILEQEYVTPLGMTPYRSFVRNGWKIKSSRHVPGPDLWQVIR